MSALGGLDPERGVAARPAAAGDQIFLLHLLGQGEELLRHLLGAVDQLLRDAMVADDGEAIFDEAVAKLLREALRVLVRIGSETEAIWSLVITSVMSGS